MVKSKYKGFKQDKNTMHLPSLRAVVTGGLFFLCGGSHQLQNHMHREIHKPVVPAVAPVTPAPQVSVPGPTAGSQAAQARVAPK